MVFQLFLSDVFDHGVRNLIVKSNYLSVESIVCEYVITGLKGFYKVTGPTQFDGEAMDVITVLIVQDEDVFVSAC